MKFWRLLLGGTLLCNTSTAQATPAPIRVLTEHLPPYQIVESQQMSGFATEIVRQTFAKAAIAYQIEAYPWSRAYQLALRTPNTCIYSISRSQERQPLFHWIGAISYNITAFYSLRKRTDIQLNTLADAKSYVTAVTKDDITHHYLAKNGFKEGEQLYLLQNISMMLNVLQNREDIDLVLVNDTILKYRAQESGIKLDALQKQLSLPELPLDFHLACSLTTNPEVISRLTRSLQQLKAQGDFAKILAAWSVQLDQAGQSQPIE
jgi:polar amino acid transport system substrate-binding protein